MTVVSLSAIAASLSLVVLHLALRLKSIVGRKALFVFASAALALALGATTQMVSICTLGGALLALLGNSNNSSLVRKFILVAIAASGNWLAPSLAEYVLLLLLVGLFLRDEREAHVGTSFIILWCLSLVIIILDHSGAFPEGNIGLLAACLLVASTLASVWLSFKKFTTITSAVLMLLFLCVRLALEKRVAVLSLEQVTVFNQVFTISYFMTLTSIVLRGITNHTRDQQSFSMLFAMSLLLPFSPDLLPPMRTTLDYSMIVAAMGVALLLPLKQERLDDNILRVLVGLIIVGSAVAAFSSLPLSRVSYLGLVLTISAQLFFLFRNINKHDFSCLQFKWERMLHYLYIGLIFGALASLWYILNYVRQIQG